MGEGGGGTLILFDTCVGSGYFFFWFKIFELHYFWAVSEILIYIWGYEEFVDFFFFFFFFWGGGQNWTSFRCLFYVF